MIIPFGILEFRILEYRSIENLDLKFHGSNEITSNGFEWKKRYFRILFHENDVYNLKIYQIYFSM